MSRPAAPLSEPLTKGSIIHSLTHAIREIHGDEVLRAVVGHLPEEVRGATTGPGFTPLGWYPTRHVVAWNGAMMTAAARDDERAFRRVVARSMQLGFGRVRRAFLSIATPVLLANRAPMLWRHEHTHGSFTVDAMNGEAGRTRLTLVGHPFIANPLSRLALAEACRQILALSRARNVRETHALTGDALTILLTWDPVRAGIAPGARDSCGQGRASEPEKGVQ